MVMTETNPKGIDHWVARLNNVELPVLAGVMKDLNSITQSDDSSASQLAELILRDASLTTKVLRIGNSAFYNPNTDNQITTISRAVVQLGFKGIKAIALSVMMIDSLLKKHSKQRMMEWLARGFHSAVQAEDLLEASGNRSDNEEVFINALLSRVGEMALWSCRGAHIDSLDQALGNNRTTHAKLEQEILGVEVRQISEALAKNWDLGQGLLKVINPSSKPDAETQAVLLGQQISLAAEKGWDSQEFIDALVDASRYTGLSLNEVKERIMANAERAASVAATYGANKICHLIPSTTETEEHAAPEPKTLQADPQLQLDILRDIGVMAQTKLDVNTLFSMVVEGMHRGVGLERVALCLIDPKVTHMQAKYVLGEDTRHWREEMRFPVSALRDNLFAYCLHSKKIIWLDNKSDDELLDLVSRRMMRFIDDSNCLMGAIYAGNRPIGLLVADRGVDGTAISAEQHESFSHFVMQTNMTLALIANKR